MERRGDDPAGGGHRGQLRPPLGLGRQVGDEDRGAGAEGLDARPGLVVLLDALEGRDVLGDAVANSRRSSRTSETAAPRTSKIAVVLSTRSCRASLTG